MDRFAALPTEIVGRIFYYYLDGKSLPILHYPMWHPGRSGIDEIYLGNPPTTLPAPVRVPQLLWDLPDPEGLAAFKPDHTHALYQTYPQFQAEYVKQMEDDMLIMIDLELDVLRDTSRWATITSPRPLPLQARHLYIRLSSDTIFRPLSSDPDRRNLTHENDIPLLIQFLKQFSHLEFLSIDAVHLPSKSAGFPGYLSDPLPAISAFPKLLKREEYFKSLERVYVMRWKFMWGTSNRSFFNVGRMLEGTRETWRRQQKFAWAYRVVTWMWGEPVV